TSRPHRSCSGPCSIPWTADKSAPGRGPRCRGSIALVRGCNAGSGPRRSDRGGNRSRGSHGRGSFAWIWSYFDPTADAVCSGDRRVSTATSNDRRFSGKPKPLLVVPSVLATQDARCRLLETRDDLLRSPDNFWFAHVVRSHEKL